MISRKKSISLFPKKKGKNYTENPSFEAVCCSRSARATQKNLIELAGCAVGREPSRVGQVHRKEFQTAEIRRQVEATKACPVSVTLKIQVFRVVLIVRCDNILFCTFVVVVVRRYEGIVQARFRADYNHTRSRPK